MGGWIQYFPQRFLKLIHFYAFLPYPFISQTTTKGTLDEQMNFCFTIYDLNDDGYIRFHLEDFSVIIFIYFSKEEMITMMKTCLVKQGSILLTLIMYNLGF